MADECHQVQACADEAEGRYQAATELYLNGIGEPQHFPGALQLFQLAAAQGHARASFCVQYMRTHGHAPEH